MRALAGILAISLGAAGCSSANSVAQEQGADEVTAVGLAPSIELEPEHDLVGRLSVSSDTPVAPEIEVVGDERTFTVPVSEAASEHEVPVVGLRAEHDYVVHVRIGDDEISLDLRRVRCPTTSPTSRWRHPGPDA